MVEKEMTGKIHTYTEKYYMPMVRSLMGVQLTSQQEDVGDENDPRMSVAFAYLARYFSLEYKLSREMESIFLGDLVAEAVLTRLSRKIRGIMLSEPTKYLSGMDISRICREVEAYELLVKLCPKLNYEPLRSIFKKYVAWRREKSEEAVKLAKYVNAYCDLFIFEINYCYKEWYKSRPFSLSEDTKPIIRDELEELREELQKERPNDLNKLEKFACRVDLQAPPLLMQQISSLYRGRGQGIGDIIML